MLRRQVLKSFKNLHATRRIVFEGDLVALEAARQRINDEFVRNKHVTDTTVLQQLIKYANEVEHELRTTVVQIRENAPGTYELRMRPEVQLLNNASYKNEGCKAA